MTNLTKLLMVLALVGTIAGSADEFVRSSAFSLDTQSLGTEITIQPDTAMAYSLNWGAVPAYRAVVTADGVAETATAEVSNYEVFMGYDTGNLNTFSWDYVSVSPEVLPRGSYTLSNSTYDDNKVQLDTFTCSVKILPEPCSMGALLLALLALAKRR